MTEIFEVLSDEARRTILRLLLASSSSEESEVSVSHIVASTGFSQPTVSKQLKVLRDAGLVSVREEGQHRLYRLDPAPLAVVEEWLMLFRNPAPPRAARRVSRKASAPDFVMDAARDLGAALADLAGKAPWR